MIILPAPLLPPRVLESVCARERLYPAKGKPCTNLPVKGDQTICIIESQFVIWTSKGYKK